MATVMPRETASAEVVHAIELRTGESPERIRQRFERGEGFTIDVDHPRGFWR